MTHKLIRTPNYLLVVDDSEIKERDYCLMFDDFGNLFLGDLPSQYLGDKSGHHLNKGLKKVIAHLQLNDSPILEGVDLLPPFSRHQEDGIEGLADLEYDIQLASYENDTSDNPFDFSHYLKSGFITGYNKAKEKYKYTEEDIRMAVRDGSAMGEVNDEEYEEYVKWIIQSLSQPKMPVAFECDVKSFEQEYRIPIREVRITTPEGHTQWVGKYIY
jgi:hypothetical protein